MQCLWDVVIITCHSIIIKTLRVGNRLFYHVSCLRIHSVPVTCIHTIVRCGRTRSGFTDPIDELSALAYWVL